MQVSLYTFAVFLLLAVMVLIGGFLSSKNWQNKNKTDKNKGWKTLTRDFRLKFGSAMLGIVILGTIWMFDIARPWVEEYLAYWVIIVILMTSSDVFPSYKQEKKEKQNTEKRNVRFAKVLILCFLVAVIGKAKGWITTPTWIETMAYEAKVKELKSQLKPIHDEVKILVARAGTKDAKKGDLARLKVLAEKEKALQKKYNPSPPKPKVTVSRGTMFGAAKPRQQRQGRKRIEVYNFRGKTTPQTFSVSYKVGEKVKVILPPRLGYDTYPTSEVRVVFSDGMSFIDKPANGPYFGRRIPTFTLQGIKKHGMMKIITREPKV